MSKPMKNALLYVWVITSFFIIANGVVFMLRAGIGVGPWDVLHLGIAYRTGITFGRVIQGMGLFIVLISWAFHVKPSIVTIMNMALIGFFVDVVNGYSYIPTPSPVWLKYVIYMVGVAICGIGVGLYISANRGAGPRDSLMMVLTKATSQRIGIIRILMEITVAILGYLLGGPLGVGTVLCALFLGFFVEIGFTIANLLKQSSLVKLLHFETVEPSRFLGES